MTQVSDVAPGPLVFFADGYSIRKQKIKFIPLILIKSLKLFVAKEYAEFESH
jgi:hypothetical protein